MKGSFAVLQAFLKAFKPKEKQVREEMGVSKIEAEIFWLALSVVEDDSLVAQDLVSAAKGAEISPSPSNQINTLKGKGYIVPGPKRGSWRVTDGAVEKMSTMLNEENVEVSKEPDATKKQPEETPEAPASTSSAPAEFELQTFVQRVKERLRVIDEKIEDSRARIENYEKEKKEIREAFENMVHEMKSLA